MAPSLQRREPLNTRGSGLVVVAIVCTIIVLIFFTLRSIRNTKIRKFGWDDTLITLATILALTYNGTLIASAIYGNGHHIREVLSTSSRLLAVQLPWLGQPLSAFAMLFAKASVGVVLLQIGLGRTFDLLVISTIFVTVFGNAWAGISVVAGCHPTEAIFNGKSGPCEPSGTAIIASYFQGAVNMYCDLAFFILPEIFLKTVQMATRDRVAVRLLLGFMLCSTIVSAVKLAELPTLLRSEDITWTSVPVSECAAFEIAFSITAACLPSTRQVLGKYFPSSWRFWRHTTSGTSAQQVSGNVNPSSKSKSKTADDGVELSQLSRGKRVDSGFARLSAKLSGNPLSRTNDEESEDERAILGLESGGHQNHTKGIFKTVDIEVK